MQLKISARQQDTKVKYINPSYSYIINNESNLEKMNFLAKSLTKEVMPKKKERKKFIKVALKTIAVSVSILTLVDPTFTFAATVTPTVIPVDATPEITSADIIKLCKYLLGICLAISFGIAMVMSVIAASLGYFRNKSNESFKWIIDIIKSFVMVMVAPTIIITIALVAYLLFGASDWFIKPF